MSSDGDADSTTPVLEIPVPAGERPTRVYWTQYSLELLVTFENGMVRKYDPKVRQAGRGGLGGERWRADDGGDG